MANLNKVMLIGRLGQDPEIKDVGSSQVANFSIATNESWTDKQNEKQERTEWHNCQAWGKLADLIGRYLFKGNQVYVEGSIQTREWMKNDEKRYSTEIKVFKIEFLESKSSDDDSVYVEKSFEGEPATHPNPTIEKIRSNFEGQPQTQRSQDAQTDDIPF